MERGVLLNVVAGEGTSILELLACRDQTRLVDWNTNLVLNLYFDHVDDVGCWFTVEGDGLHKELHDLSFVHRS